MSFTPEHWLGHFYLQQAATGVAPLALGARPGERILDLCAAPGGKASHIAELQERSGVLVANDGDERRLRALLGNLYRLGHTGVLVVSGDGRTFPGGVLFDRALVDVPCSGEGNPRRRSGKRRDRPAFRGQVTGVQRGLLRRAVEQVRPGGTVLYVTCSAAPEENEAVAAWALRRLPLSVEPITLDVPHDRGLSSYGGVAFPAELAHAWRLTPEHLESGCLFMARFRREGRGGESTSDEGWKRPPDSFPLPEDSRDSRQLLDHAQEKLHQEMGVGTRVLDGLHWMVRGGSVWLHSCDEWPGEVWAGSTNLVSFGIRAFRIESGGRLRATNDLFRWLDSALSERVITLDRDSCAHLLEVGEVSLSKDLDGYVALRLEDRVIGRGWVRGGRLKSEIPKSQARPLSEALRVSKRAASKARDQEPNQRVGVVGV